MTSPPKIIWEERVANPHDRECNHPPASARCAMYTAYNSSYSAAPRYTTSIPLQSHDL